VKLDVFEKPIRYPEFRPSGKMILNATTHYVALP
jgi:hypothetical protein